MAAKKAKSFFENNGTPAELRAAVDAVWERLVHERAARGGR